MKGLGVGGFLALFLIACGDDSTPPMKGPPPPYTAPSTDWCQRIHGGPSGAQDPALDLSDANAGIRFFGVEKSLKTVDLALQAALEMKRPIVEALPQYAQALQGACVVAPDDRPLPAAGVDRLGDVAIVHPGSGPIELPPSIDGVAIDLRDLPAAPGLRAALEAAVSPALATPIPRPPRTVRKRDGMNDEVLAPTTNVYTNMAEDLTDDPPIPAAGTRDFPIALLTSPTLAPEAAEFAATLRMAGRVWLEGEDVLASVAESRWNGIGASGVAWRDHDLGGMAARWPDVIPADDHLADATYDLDILPTRGRPHAIGPTAGADARPAVLAVPAQLAQVNGNMTRGAIRADLVICHGAVRRFWGYLGYSAMPADLDARLLETLTSVDDPMITTRNERVYLLRRFGEALHDGHNFIGGDVGSGYFAVKVDQVNGQPVVRRSATPGVNPGDTITSIGGMPIADWYAREFMRTSAATQGYQFDLATRYLLELGGPTDFGLRDPAGADRVVTVQPQSVTVQQGLGFSPILRPSGYLNDLGAPTIYYFNMASEVLSDINTAHTQLAAASTATGLVVDMRGYPGIDHYDIAARLNTAQFHTPHFHWPTYDGIDRMTFTDELDPLDASGQYTGPIVLLVSPITVSAAENFSIMLVDAQRVTVIGRTSAGTNGNITGVMLPGSASFSFTGMEIRHADGSAFEGIGIVPSMTVAPTVADIASGNDPELAAAITALPH